MKKNSVWIISWTLVNILFSMTNQYLLTLPKKLIIGLPSVFYPILGWDTSIILILYAGPILGVFGALIFLLIDSFTFRKKIKDKYILFFSRITLVIFVVVLISFIQKKYF